MRDFWVPLSSGETPVLVKKRRKVRPGLVLVCPDLADRLSVWPGAFFVETLVVVVVLVLVSAMCRSWGVMSALQKRYECCLVSLIEIAVYFMRRTE